MPSSRRVQSPCIAITNGSDNACITSWSFSAIRLLTLQVMHQSAVTSMNTTRPSLTRAGASSGSKDAQMAKRSEVAAASNVCVCGDSNKTARPTRLRIDVVRGAILNRPAATMTAPMNARPTPATNATEREFTPAITLSNQKTVAARASPKALRNFTIQLPGFGKDVANLGNSVTSRNGAASPSPRNVKIVKISLGPEDKAKPTAVPTNGAEQGVARSVANTPVKNCRAGFVRRQSGQFAQARTAMEFLTAQTCCRQTLRRQA